MINESTVIALSTSILKSAIAVIRLSGKNSLTYFNQLSDKKIETANLAVYTTVYTSKLKDDVIAVFFKGPKSYTGEDMVEISCHGNHIIIESIIEEFIKMGAKTAEKGEFTMRAFQNGKLDLTSAESVIDLIDAESTFEVNNAFKITKGNLFKKIEGLQQNLINLLSSIEVVIDYPEEGVEEITKEETNRTIEAMINDCLRFKNSYSSGSKLKSGVKVVIYGDTNVGKSSLLNKLTQTDRAIVTEIEGTTRDVVTESYEYKDVRFIVSDTAGIRETNDQVEKIGIERSKRAAEEADIIINLSDGNSFKQTDYKNKNVVKVLNKAFENNEDKTIQCDLKISVKLGKNIEELKKLIYKKTVDQNAIGDEITLTNFRQYECICSAQESLERVKENLQKVPFDMITVDLNEAYLKLGEITGVTASDEVIGRIFERFCVGK